MILLRSSYLVYGNWIVYTQDGISLCVCFVFDTCFSIVTLTPLIMVKRKSVFLFMDVVIVYYVILYCLILCHDS